MSLSEILYMMIPAFPGVIIGSIVQGIVCGLYEACRGRPGIGVLLPAVISLFGVIVFYSKPSLFNLRTPFCVGILLGCLLVLIPYGICMLCRTVGAKPRKPEKKDPPEQSSAE